MSKRQSTQWQPEIDQEYESQVSGLDTINGHVSDYPDSYAIEPARPAAPTTWTPAQTPQQAQQAQRQQTVGQLRQMIDQQSAEPARTDTGNRFVINESTSAKDRASAGVRWYALGGLSAMPLALGLGLWLFWGWGFFAFCFTFVGGGTLLGAILLYWMAVRSSPIAIEKKQRGLDHEYRMYREENAQRTRELVIGGFIGNARQDLANNAPATNSPLLLVDSRNEVQR